MFNPLKFITRIIKSSNERELERIAPLIDKTNKMEDEIKKLSKEECIIKTNELIEKVKNGTEISKIIPTAFSLVREASKRVNNERHFDVQLIGGVVLTLLLKVTELEQKYTKGYFQMKKQCL